MATGRRRKLYAAIVGLLLLGGLVGSAAYGLKLSIANRFGNRESSMGAADEHQIVEAATVQTASRGGVETVTATTFDEQVLRSADPVLVDFYADWCGPCQIQHGILEELAAEVEGIKIVKVDVDQDAELAQRFQVNALPTLLIVKDGLVIGRHTGVATKKQLLSVLAS